MMLWLAVGAGGAVGAMSRYALASAMTRMMGPWFPWGTLAVNVLGGLAMGMLVEMMALKWNPSPEVRTLLTTGFLGGFTTFSAFSLDAWLLIDRHDYLAAASYIGGSVIASIAALVAGLMLVRGIYA